MDRPPMRAFLLLAVALAGCQLPGPTARYLVTGRPIVVGHGIEQCVALDPSDVRGVWWWGPGATGCATRSTGPDVFRAQDARITELPASGELLVTYELEPMFGRPIHVLLHVDGRFLRVGMNRGAVVVPLHDRDDLSVPERP